MKKEETIDYQIKSCWHSISRMYNQKANMEGITTSMGFVLINIHSTEGTAATKIAPQMGLESRSLTRLLKTMVEKELIVKVPDKEDKRSVKVFLTEKGKQKKAAAVSTIKEFNEKVREHLSEEEFGVFFVLFDKINSVIDELQKPETK
ncbi:MarR family winged helix-turn-helix transcriptional regulator [Cyclobacterium amurskyense]|uniref:Transcriptional regulator, MarR family n=1 Tax=Cyclobacterium amurskyense TaxID=320787 RepID=A0A0H4PEB7_9BACT|nr:MarR family transcriptional regulator [Cyclobacterium amurskyense]AKP51153.1 Transcriptional regulator, MarR family [Cyclobacterium amurskyense]|tara:strand:+ start:15404 stop:15847 length:444 start_codon:yes stop_codon:yes gene_type:complete